MVGNIIVGIIILLAVAYLVKIILKVIKNKENPCCHCKSKKCHDKKK